MYEHISVELRDLFEYYSYEIADVKTILFDIDGCARGLAGAKKPFDINKLPSYKKANTVKVEEQRRTETEEQRLERHKRFFEGLKSLGDKKEK
jgi:hypothetical protein